MELKIVIEEPGTREPRPTGKPEDRRRVESRTPQTPQPSPVTDRIRRAFLLGHTRQT